MSGYHLEDIKKGVLGELSKIQEELDEIKDAENQDCKIMIHAELADLYGAVEAYANKYGLTMYDLDKMNQCTKRAFESGRRTSDESPKLITFDSIDVEFENAIVNNSKEISDVINDSPKYYSFKNKNIILHSKDFSKGAFITYNFDEDIDFNFFTKHFKNFSPHILTAKIKGHTRSIEPLYGITNIEKTYFTISYKANTEYIVWVDGDSVSGFDGKIEEVTNYKKISQLDKLYASL